MGGNGGSDQWGEGGGAIGDCGDGRGQSLKNFHDVEFCCKLQPHFINFLGKKKTCGLYSSKYDGFFFTIISN